MDGWKANVQDFKVEISEHQELCKPVDVHQFENISMFSSLTRTSGLQAWVTGETAGKKKTKTGSIIWIITVGKG